MAATAKLTAPARPAVARRPVPTVARAAPAPARTGPQNGAGNAATARALGTTNASAAALLGDAQETVGNSAVATSLSGPPAAANTREESGVGAWFRRKAGAVGRFFTDQGWALLERFAPELVPILRQGVGNWLRDQLANAMRSLFAVLTAPVRALGGAVDVLKSVFGVLLGWMRTGVAKVVSTSCAVLSGAADRITHVVDGIDAAEAGALGKLKDLAGGAGKFLGGLWDRLGAPVADLLGRTGSAVWGKIQQVARWLWDKTQPIRDTVGAAWDWLKDVIGIGDGPEGRNGIIQWVQARAQEAWDWLKAKLGPISTPLKIAGGVLLLLSPAGPFLAAGAAAYGVVKGARWLWENLTEPGALVRMRKALVNDILPPLIDGVGTVVGKIKQGTAWLGGMLSSAWQDLQRLAGELSAPILGPLRELVDWLGQQASGLLDWVNRNVFPLSELVATGLTHLKRLGSLLVTVLKKVISVVANPFGIAGLIEGAAWRALPSCMRQPILRFLLTIVKGALKLMPVTLLGPLGAVIREALIGFVDRALEGESLAKLEQLADRFAKIATEGSWDFTVGYGLGLLKGVWDGISGPFVLLWDIAKLIGNAVAWLAKTVIHGLPPALLELVNAIRRTWDDIRNDIWPAVRTFFSAPIDVGRIIQLVRGVMAQIARAARAAGAQVFDSVMKFLRQPDRKLGESIGYVTGVIVFEVALTVLTSGGYAAKPIIERVAALFTKAAARITELLSALGSLLPRITSVLRMVREFAATNPAMKRIAAGVEWLFQKFLAYLRMSYGLAGTEERAGTRAESEADDLLEHAAELPAALLAAKGIAAANERVGAPVPVVLAQLTALKTTFRWIKRFEAEPRAIPGHYALYLIASRRTVDPDYDPLGHLSAATRRIIDSLRRDPRFTAHLDGAIEQLGRNADEVLPLFNRIKDIPGAEFVLKDLAAGKTKLTGAIGELRFTGILLDEGADVTLVGERFAHPATRAETEGVDIVIGRGQKVFDVKNFDYDTNLATRLPTGKALTDPKSRETFERIQEMALKREEDRMARQVASHKSRWPDAEVWFVFRAPRERIPQRWIDAITKAGGKIRVESF
ncbi:hypothetical protein H4696_008601 [Amycolatopsis lexingtonensis]|uniref:Uncharacterized protein n=1 Tax=Amycolatopsis lexingtonensis TaxID=218822 RepID=A0ABR9IEB8_9PSEU|nr:hypothetical protein [Amycolatopsis lexingtonensis]MBE1501501.1 hypothetical protein [Amycolatopsis lexingtonensis]